MAGQPQANIRPVITKPVWVMLGVSVFFVLLDRFVNVALSAAAPTLSHLSAVPTAPNPRGCGYLLATKRMLLETCQQER